MQIVKAILVGMVLAVTVISLPGHTAAQSSSGSSQTATPPRTASPPWPLYQALGDRRLTSSR